MKINGITKSILTEKGETKGGYAWIVLVVIFIASVSAPVNHFKVPPVMPALISEFGLNMTMAGLLMSMFSLAGLCMAFPAGLILSKLGQKKTIVTALVLIITGSLIGTFSASTIQLLTSRVFEGAGMVMLGVTAPVIISSWFPPERRGLPMGIWSAWVSTGVIIIMNTSPLVSPPGQWVQTWWLATGYALMAMMLFIVLYKNPVKLIEKEAEKQPPILGMFREALSKRDVWLISIALFTFNISVLAMNTFFPTYLNKLDGLPMGRADFLSSIPNMAMLISCPLGGWLADKTGSRKMIFSICLLLLGVWWWAAFRTPIWALPILMAAFGLIGGPIISAIVTALPDAVRRPALIGFGMSLLMFWHHLGEFTGPLYFGKIVDKTANWETAALFMIPVCVLGGVAGFLMKENRKL